MELGRFLSPRRIAVIGGRVAARVVAACDRLGFAGTIDVVHPTAGEIAGRRAVARVGDLPAPPDAAFLAVNRHEAVRLVSELAECGAGGAVVHASGFAEAGEDGKRLQRALVEATRGMPVFGPNCLGYLNYLDRVALWPDQHGGMPVERGVAFVLQSGNIAINLTMQRRGIPIAFVASLGNQAALGPSALIHALVADPRITAIGLYLETIDQAEAFIAAVGEARARRIPVVALRVGGSEASREAALGHTASLASEDLLARAWFERLGVPLVDDLPSLLAATALLHRHGPLRGRRVVSLSCSGGEAALVAETAARSGLRFPPFAGEAQERLKAELGPLVRIANPLDYHTFIWGDAERMRATFAAALASSVDFGMLVLDWPRADRCTDADWVTAMESFAAASRASGTPAALVATLPDCLPEERARTAEALGLAALAGVREALAAIEAAASIGEAWRDSGHPPVAASQPAAGPSVNLDEGQAKAELARFGIPVVAGGEAADLEEARALAERLGFPLAVKGLSADLLHKTEAGAVRLGIDRAAALDEVCRELFLRFARLRIERMVEGAVAELLLGFRRDPVLGPFLLLGAGGIFAELFADRVALPLPLAPSDVERALVRLRIFPLLRGYRGKPPGDVAAVTRTVWAFARFLEARLERLVEAEINPLLVLPEGRGCVAVDAFLRIVAEGEAVA